MHPLFFFGAIHHVLVVAVVAFFVLFAASKAEGFVKSLGKVLGYLLLIFAVLLIVCAAFAPTFDGRTGFGATHWGMSWGYHMQGPPPAHPAPPPGK
jgi:branched-subunit amino acid transport protein AzlD